LATAPSSRSNPRLRLLAYEAPHDIQHLPRTSHLQQLANILDDPEASANDTSRWIC
jgi:fumarate hydratase class I